MRTVTLTEDQLRDLHKGLQQWQSKDASEDEKSYRDAWSKSYGKHRMTHPEGFAGAAREAFVEAV